MTVTTPLWGRSLTEIAAGYRRRRITPTEVLDACRRRAAATASVDAFVSWNPAAGAEAAAATCELGRGADRGILHGIPFGVKDLIDVAGEVTTAGSPLLTDAAPAAGDAPVVAKLRAAGAVMAGRTRTHEFAWGISSRHSRLPSVSNPWDARRVAGGSSGGSAAAVATGAVVAALGTDTGGSVRIPAAYCGVVGIKPTAGALPTAGIVPLAPSFDTVGVLTRSTADAAAALAALGVLATAALPDVEGLSVAVLHDDSWPPCAPATTAAVADAAAALRSAGARLHDASIDGGRAMLDTFSLIQRYEALHVHRDQLGFWPARRDDYAPDIAARLHAAEAITSQDAAAARRHARELVARLDAALDGADVALLPVGAGPPPTIADPDHMMVGGRRGPARDLVLPFTVPANLSGRPALAQPTHLDPDGLPAAVQLLGRPGREAQLLAAAAAIELRCPPLGWPTTTHGGE